MKLNRINAYLIGCGLSLAGCSSLSSQHSTNPTLTNPTSGDLLHIDNITIGHMKNDTSNQFTIKLALSAQSLQNIDGWKIGFFMPRVLDKHSGIANKSLSMTVCEQNSSQCSKLIYQKNSFTANDLSTGFTSILAPKDNFTLRAGKRYVITLAHINTPLLNYSSVPQSWFLITPNNQVINLAVSPASYQLIDYNGTQIQRQVAEHNQDNWNDSAKLTTPLNVIPSPNQIVFEQHGQLTLGNQVMIVDKSSFNHNSESFLIEYLKQEQQISRTHHHTAGVKLIEFSAANFTNPEAYAINITPNKILISSNTRTGGFYAVQTLRQIFAQYGRNIPTMTINDAPRFKYRGLMLDSARHYFTPNEIQNLLDLMALQKLNTLHWHLSDDEAFRIALSDYPQLSTIGATSGYGQPLINMRIVDRNLDTATSKTNSQFINVATIYQGSYSASEIRQLINYANARQITIIPEIDIPGHSRAMMKAMPDSFYDPQDKSLYGGYGDDTLPVCSYNQNTPLGTNFTRDITAIVKQVSDLFNQQTTLYQVAHEVSIGGDEVNKNAWTKTPICQQNSGYANLNALQKEHKFLAQLGNSAPLSAVKLSGWEEFVLDDDGTLENNSANVVPAQKTGHVWIWQKTHPTQARYAVELANHDYPTVLDYASNLYFDNRYTAQKEEPGLYWATNYSDTAAALDATSALSKTTKLIATDKRQNIVGLEGALWTDVIPNYEHLVYMALPKMSGLAEASWSLDPDSDNNSQANWQSLARRLGCGSDGLLHFINQTYALKYRGYPNGIALEAPALCNASATNK
mgnify:FL=1